MRYIIPVSLHTPSIYYHFLTWLMSLKSWETNTKPPSKLLMASARASMVSMSKWLVGSSSSSIWGDCHAIQAKTTRHRWPSLNCFSGDVCKKRQYTYLCFLWMVSNQIPKQLFWISSVVVSYLGFSWYSVSSNNFSHFIAVFEFREHFQHVI